MASDGYGVDNGQSALWMKDIPEYGYPLGVPKEPADKEGYVYRREFAHASVWLDLGQEKARIEWKSKAP